MINSYPISASKDETSAIMDVILHTVEAEEVQEEISFLFGINLNK